jgi:large subunit ribosomal protein L21
MIAVVQIGGHQAIVQEGEKLEVDKINAEVGQTVEFDTLLVSQEDGTDFQIGDPILKNVKVTATILEHGLDDKIRVYKMKAKKRYRRTQGHRQDYTLIEIKAIGAGSAKKSAPKKEPKEVTPKAE